MQNGNQHELVALALGAAQAAASFLQHKTVPNGTQRAFKPSHPRMHPSLILSFLSFASHRTCRVVITQWGQVLIFLSAWALGASAFYVIIRELKQHSVGTPFIGSFSFAVLALVRWTTLLSLSLSAISLLSALFLFLCSLSLSSPWAHLRQGHEKPVRGGVFHYLFSLSLSLSFSR